MRWHLEMILAEEKGEQSDVEATKCGDGETHALDRRIAADKENG
jgi:hypothetical protein